MTTRNNPFEMMEQFFERMSNQFDDAADAWERGETFDRWGAALGTESMAIDMIERDDEIVLAVDVPGFEKDEIDVEIVGDELRIEADHEEEAESEDETYVHRERTHRTLRRTITLPSAVDVDEVSATVEKGVLTITLPKAEPTSEGKHIEIAGR